MRKRIVIVGGGFVGLRTARLLSKHTRGLAEITLVDHNERFVFSPWLIDALAGSLRPEDISEPYETVAKRDGFVFVRGEAMDADRERNIVDVRLPDGIATTLAYHILVLCPGSHVASYGIPGAMTAAYPLKTLPDLARIRDGLRELVVRARTADESSRKDLMHIVVVGGGPSGIEVLFATKRFLERDLLADTPQLKKDLRFTLLDAGPEILPGFRATLVAGTRDTLEKQGVEVMNDDPVASVGEGHVLTKSGKQIKTGFVLWCAGVEPNDILIKPDVSRDAKRCPAPDAALRLAPDMFAAGDAIVCEADGKPVARTAQVAMMQAGHLAKNIRRVLEGKEPQAFTQQPKGSLLALGKTGYIDTPWFDIRTPLAIPLRRLFYRYRFWQMTGRG